ncbi:hypothetical protein GQ55_1G081000 [Panicum hallii var. hallii]|uniref:Acyl-[acyl-carrier-protein] hydrolase n=1 Tax=Panicum hallii var. hallii TaxID=1504633 RepID=A0A2T7F3H8_9POAL|nr:hypothetical protein GQ55_1G081000 [Panicum hallii var. hallii]PUZ74637.1 hypothetical protein GQ55_1G081000 [Panicum hallii var. hallii]
MAASVASSAFFPAPAPAPKNGTGGSSKDSLDMRGVAGNAGVVRSSARLRATVPKVSGGGGKAAVTDGEDEAARPSAPRTFYNQLPDWSVLLAAITTIFLAAERQWTLVDWKPKRPDMLIDTFGFSGQVFRQDFSIRSYEIGADRTASIETLMNHLQETALNHVKSAGLLGDGFGSTPEMSKRNLFWVVSQMQVLVEQYPCWGDTVGIDTWVSGHGKNGMRRDWHLHDCNTGQTILRATSKWVMMHKHTRKLARFPDEVRTEIAPYFFERTAIADEDRRKLPKLPGNGGAMASKYVRTGLTSAPISIFENHELASIVLDYKRECGRDSVLQSHTTVFTACIDGSGETTLQCEHLLCLESGHTIVKARTMWRPKKTNAMGTLTPVSASKF